MHEQLVKCVRGKQDYAVYAAPFYGLAANYLREFSSGNSTEQSQLFALMLLNHKTLRYIQRNPVFHVRDSRTHTNKLGRPRLYVFPELEYVTFIDTHTHRARTLIVHSSRRGYACDVSLCPRPPPNFRIVIAILLIILFWREVCICQNPKIIFAVEKHYNFTHFVLLINV